MRMLKNKFLITIFTLILTANTGFCEEARAAVVHDIFIKFVLAMGGVIVSSIIIFLGLHIYNKMFYGQNRNLTYEEEILKTPKTKEEAIRFFIRKNRVK